MHTYETTKGNFDWNTKLNKREKSGYVGQYTVNIQITGEDLAQIQQKLKASDFKPNVDALINVDWTSKTSTEEAILKYFNIERPKPEPKVNSDALSKYAQLLINKTNEHVYKLVNDNKNIDYKQLEQKVLLKCKALNLSDDETKTVLKQTVPSEKEKIENYDDVFNFD